MIYPRLIGAFITWMVTSIAGVPGPYAVAAAASDTTSAPSPVVTVHTELVRRQTVTRTLAAYGTVTPIGGAESTVSARHGGKLEQLRVSMGQPVRRGEALFDLVPTEQDRLNVEQARSALTLAQGELQRTQRLFDQQLATESQLATARKSLDDAQAAWRGLQRTGVSRQTDTVTAPFDGTVSSLAAGQGDVVATGTAVLKLARAGAVQVQLGVEPEDVTMVRAGMLVKVRPLLARQPVTQMGRVTTVAGAVNAQSRMVNVAVRLDPGQAPLLIGSRVEGVVTQSAQDALTVPRSSVLKDDKGSYVFLISSGMAHRVPVDVGGEYGDRLAVAGALQAGQAVVSLGNYELNDGMHVRDGGR